MEKQNNKYAWLIFAPPFALTFLVLALFGHLLCFSIFEIIFFIVASISIYIYAHHAFHIHNLDIRRVETEEKVVTRTWEKLEDNKWYIYNQYWLNGLGAFIGWLALYLLLFGRIGIGQPYFDLEWFVISMDWQDFALGLVAFFGITGHFPLASLLGKLPGK